MRIENLKYFIEICKYGSISKAAEANFMLRQTMSSIVTNLENELEVPLLERLPSGCQPTEYGIKFLEQAQIILDAYQIMLQLKSPETKNNIHIGLPSAFNKKLFNTIFSELKKKCPEINISTIVANSGHIEELFPFLLNKEIDILFAILDTTSIQNFYRQISNHYDLLVIHEEPLSFIVYKNHPLAKCKTINEDMLKKQTILLTFNDIKYKNIMSKFSTNIVYAPDFNSAFYYLTTGDYGFPMPKSVLLDYARDDYIAIDFSWEISELHQYVLFYPKEKFLTHAEKLFVKIFKKYAHTFYNS